MKMRDILKGFFGWVILGNIIFVLLLFLQLKIQASLSNILVLIILWLPTVTTSLVLFVKKRIWIGTGVVSAVIINAGIWLIILSSFETGLPRFTTETIMTMGIPLPSGLLLFMLMQ